MSSLNVVNGNGGSSSHETLKTKMTSGEKYLFDLNGYIIVKNVLNTAEVKNANEAINQSSPTLVEDGQLVGIVSFKDMMSRAIAKELPLELSDATTIMTADPESVSPDTTILEALQIMHDNKFLTLPVCESNGSIIGIVDVMDLVYEHMGVEERKVGVRYLIVQWMLLTIYLMQALCIVSEVQHDRQSLHVQVNLH